MVENEGVERVVHAEPDRIQILIDEKTGQAFIIAQEEIQSPITLCVITTEGDVQDIEATFQEMPSQLIILHKNQEDLLDKMGECQPACDTIQTTINFILSNQIPPYLSRIPFEKKECWKNRKIKIVEISRLESSTEILRIFNITNCSRRKQLIYEKELATSGTSWVYVEKNELLCKETVLAVVSIKKT